MFVVAIGIIESIIDLPAINTFNGLEMFKLTAPACFTMSALLSIVIALEWHRKKYLHIGIYLKATIGLFFNI